jgi:hypothetical protein
VEEYRRLLQKSEEREAQLLSLAQQLIVSSSQNDYLNKYVKLLEQTNQ